MLGQAFDGFATVFQSGLHVDNGATRESNFHNFKWTRMFDTPLEASVHIIPSTTTLPRAVQTVAFTFVSPHSRTPRSQQLDGSGRCATRYRHTVGKVRRSRDGT